MSSFNIENIAKKYQDVISSNEWIEIQQRYNLSDDIYVIGNGGNLAIADHAAIDMTRLSGGKKNAQSPGSAIRVTSIINDYDYDNYLMKWLELVTKTRTTEQKKKSLVLGISSSGGSKNVFKAMEWAEKNGMMTAIITAKPPRNLNTKKSAIVELGCDFYHTSEVLTLLLTYVLTHDAGYDCPPIPSKESEANKHWRGHIREHSYPDEQVNIGIDFDGVIHKCSKGFYDGTIYDEPVEGVRKALEALSKDNNIIIFTCKAKPDRPLVNGQTGTELIWDWLRKHNMAQFVSEVTAEKPRAKMYIDDKAIKFTNWEEILINLNGDK